MDDRLDLLNRLHKARMAFNRYNQRMLNNPDKKAELTPILQGCRELVDDLEQRFKELERRQAASA
jgi:hypothetical protein